MYLRNLALGAILLFSFSDAIAKPLRTDLAACARLMKFVQANNIDYGQEEFPEDLNFDFKRPEIEQFFYANETLWTMGFDRNELLRFAQKFYKGIPLTQREQIEYKKTRARFKQLRFAFALYDKSHEYPEFVNVVTRTMGELQDAEKNHHPEIVKKKAGELIELLRKNQWATFIDEISSFTPSSRKQFEAAISEQIDFLRGKLKKQGVTGKTFHKMRKVVSRMVALFSAVNLLYPSSENQQAFEFLSTLNRRIGDLHDHLVSLKFSGSLDYENDKFKVPDDIRRNLQKLINAFEPVLKSS